MFILAYIQLTGADLSGAEGTGRTYTVSIPSLINSSLQIQLDNQFLIPTNDYVFNTGTGIITFYVYIADVQNIILYYSTTASATTTGNAYTTATLVEAEIRAANVFSSSTTPTLSQVNTWIDEASREIDSMTGQVFASTAISSTYVDYDGSGILRLGHAPILSMTELLYNVNSVTAASSMVALEEGYGKNYLLYGDEGELEFINGNNATNKYVPQKGKKKFVASYSYGYATVPATVQHLATLMVAKRVILSLINSQANTEGGAISVGTIRIEDPSVFSTNYIKTLSSEIDILREQIKAKFKVFRQVRVYD